MNKIAIAVTAALIGLGAAPALAGDASWQYADGMKLRVKCSNSACKVTAKKPDGKWMVVEKTKGGRDNFLVLEAKYKAEQPKY